MRMSVSTYDYLAGGADRTYHNPVTETFRNYLECLWDNEYKLEVHTFSDGVTIKRWGPYDDADMNDEVLCDVKFIPDFDDWCDVSGWIDRYCDRFAGIDAVIDNLWFEGLGLNEDSSLDTIRDAVMRRIDNGYRGHDAHAHEQDSAFVRKYVAARDRDFLPMSFKVDLRKMVNRAC